MIREGDRVVYWYNIGREGTVIDFVQAPADSVWLQGSNRSIPRRPVVKFDDGEIVTYAVSDLRTVE